MWIYLENESNCINLSHVSRLYVEVTGTGAALKADLNGKTIMIGYYEHRDLARAALNELIARREAGAEVVRLGRG
jgi:hypothetical protein